MKLIYVVIGKDFGCGNRKSRIAIELAKAADSPAAFICRIFFFCCDGNSNFF